jgi:hypothetical protein
MKIAMSCAKPRNPLVAAALFRRAGTHRPTGKSQRQAARAAMRRELAALPRCGPCP